jgi:hypothetical protein
MEKEKNQPRPLQGRAKQARQTWFWTHLFFGVLFVVVAVVIYQKADRTMLALIFGGVGLIELVNVFTNPFRAAKK